MLEPDALEGLRVPEMLGLSTLPSSRESQSKLLGRVLDATVDRNLLDIAHSGLVPERSGRLSSFGTERQLVLSFSYQVSKTPA